MKKLFCCLFICCILFTSMVGVSFGEETSESAFDTFLLKKGVLLSKEFIDFDRIKLVNSNPINIQIATLTNAETNERYKCLRLSFVGLSSLSGKLTTVAIVLDADEVDSAIAALNYMVERLESNSLKDYTELVFQTNDGAIFSLIYSGQDDIDFLIKNSTGYMSMEASSISAIVQSLTKAKAELIK